MKNQRILIAAVFLLMTAGGAVMMMTRRPDVPDLSKDEPPFNAMLMPPRSVGATAYLDGGSIGVWVIDGRGTTFDFAFPNEGPRASGTYQEVFLGAWHRADPGATPAKDPRRAKEICLLLLKNYARAGDKHSAAMYYQLSGTAPTSAVKFYWRVREMFD